MLSQNEAQKILDALDFFSQFKEAKTWEGMPRASFFDWLTRFYKTDNLPEIRKTLEKISSGAISPNTIPLEVSERAKEIGISKEDFEVEIQKQRSYVKEWINSIAKTKTPEQSVATQVKAAEAAAKIERDAKILTSTEKTTEQKAAVKETVVSEPEKIPAEKPEVVEEVLIPVTGTETYKAEVGQAPQSVQIKLNLKQPIDQAERINATQPFLAAAEKIKNSEFIDRNPALSLIGNGISAKEIESASKSLPGSTRSSILRISKTMSDIERIFPDEVSRIRNLISVKNLEVQIAKIDFTPSANGILLNPNINPYGGYTAIGGSSELGVIGDFAKNKVLDLASDKILSKVQGAIGDKLTKGAIGKAVSSFGQKLAGTAIGKAISAIGAKIGAALGFFGGPLVAAITAIIGAIVSAIAGWIMEKLGPLLQKIKDWAKKASRAALATAATIILLPFTLFISSIALPFLIIFITLPISVALILFIINSGAYIVPPSESIFKSENAYVEVVKDAVPSGPFQNSNLPIKIKYTISIRAKKDVLTNIRFSHTCKAIKESSQTNCDSPLPPDKPSSISPASPYVFSYETSYAGNSYQDSLVLNTFTVTADSSEAKDQTTSGSVSIIIGKAPTQCLEISGSWPGGYKANMENAVAFLISNQSNFIAKVCSGGKLPLKYSPTPKLWWGFFGGTYIEFYSGGLDSEIKTRYILAHELAHALAKRIPSIFIEYKHFPGITSEILYCYYTYDTSEITERFAEAVSFYAVDPCGNFKSKNPINYRFVKDKVYK